MTPITTHELPLTPRPHTIVPTRPADLSQNLPRLVRRPKRVSAPTPSHAPPPQTLPLPAPSPPEQIIFKHPVRRVLSPHDHELFLASPTHALITSFILTVSDSIQDTSISAVASQPQHPTIAAVLSILSSAIDILAENPPSDNNGSRFGNPTFRSFLTSLTEQLSALHSRLFPELSTHPGAIDELTTYLSNAFGSPTRLDYGSGHELNFLVYLLCLYQLSLLPRTAFPHVALLLLPAYLRLMRSLQSAYYLEPAGSHGVWGLDDYHFLPFLFGASQLHSHPFIRPLAIHSQVALDAHADDYMYLDMVRSVNATKTVKGLRWHSPMLDDISGVREGWGKIEGGMRKMFEKEVLGKLVVMQHFLFGGLVPAVEGMSGREQAEPEVDGGRVGNTKGNEGHAHKPDVWGDCCGIKVPSSVGAVQEMRKRTGGDGLRPIPFD